MEIRTWGILDQFAQPIKAGSIQFVGVELPTQPNGIEDAIKRSWDKELHAKQDELAIKGDRMVVGPHLEPLSGNNLDALYEEQTGKRKMWSGPVVTLREIRRDISVVSSRIFLAVSQMHFAYINGLNDPEVTALYTAQQIEKPRSSLAVSTFAETTEGLLVLTVRGDRTNMYPNRLYGQGGNPQTPMVDIIEHQIREMRDEILVEPEEYDPRGFEFFGIVEDLEGIPNKPDLVGAVRINLSFDEVRRRVEARGKYPNDAVGVDFAPSTAEDLQYYLAIKDPRDYCPPAFAGLILFGASRYGELWKKDLLQDLS